MIQETGGFHRRHPKCAERHLYLQDSNTDDGRIVRMNETVEEPTLCWGFSFDDTHLLHMERYALHSVGETRGEGVGLSISLS